MIGTEITALTTAAQYSALIGFDSTTLITSPATIAAARIE